LVSDDELVAEIELVEAEEVFVTSMPGTGLEIVRQSRHRSFDNVLLEQTQRGEWRSRPTRG
jgi:hypothetical protein